MKITKYKDIFFLFCVVIFLVTTSFQRAEICPYVFGCEYQLEENDDMTLLLESRIQYNFIPEVGDIVTVKGTNYTVKIVNCLDDYYYFKVKKWN